MRFCRVGDRVVAFTNVRVHKGGEGRKQRRIRIFTESGPVVDLPPSDFQDMVQDGTIQRLDLPHDLKDDAEGLSDQIGDTYTPQEALRIFQRMIQEHPTTLDAEVVGRA